MASRNQIEASRRNGAKSKGPVTPEGKARVSQNGIKHGIYAQTVVLENEDEDLYNIWRDNHLAEWAPATDTEHNLVIDIVDARWRLRRLSILETKAIDFELGRMQPEIDEAFETIDQGTRTVLGLNSLVTLNRTWEVIQTSMRSQHRIIDRAVAQLIKLGKLRRPLDGDGPAAAGSDDTMLSVSSNDQPACTEQPDTQQPAGQQQPSTAAAAANSEEQTRQTSAVASATTQNRESKPEPVAIGSHAQPRVILDTALHTLRRAA